MRDMIRDNGRIGFLNLILALSLGVLTCLMILIWGVPGLDPSLWGETAVVAGLRPPQTIFPGFWRVLSGWIFSLCGIDSAISLLSFFGAAVAGVCVSLTYLIVRQILALLIRTGRPYAVWCDRIAPFFAAVASFLFAISDPLWRIAQVFSPEELRFVMFLAIVHIVLRWFVVGGRWRLFPVMALMGFLAAETPFGFLLPLIFVVAYVLVWHCIIDGLFMKPENLPEPTEMPKWRMFFLFLGGLALAVWMNAANFVSLGGLMANGWSGTDIYFRYAGGYWGMFASASSLIGWALGLGFCVFPFVVALRVFPMIVRDDRPMPFNLGVIMFFIGAMAVMQCGAFPAARFWTFTKDVVLVNSGFLLTFFVFCAMIALAMFGASFAFECQRTYLTEEDVKPGILLKGVAPVLATCVLLLSLLHVSKPVETEMQRIVDAAVQEIVEEAGDAKFIFTDGQLDPAIEIAAATRGKSLWALNMMSGASPWEVAIRRRHFSVESEDYKSAETGVPMLLRIWAGEKPQGLDEAAIQLGFEFWKRAQRPLPTASGMVAREVGMDKETAEAGIERSKVLATRILALGPKLEKADSTPALERALSAVNWRLSRFARMRNDEDLANELDLSNGALKRMLSIIEYERLRTFMQMTPREGLQLALKRADFMEARRYAAAVLRYDEDDPEANFGMGMSALVQNQMKDAEFYLKKCLKRRPDEPAVLNNLSIICRKAKRYKEAEDYARKALKMLPDSQEIQRTLQDALKKAP